MLGKLSSGLESLSVRPITTSYANARSRGLAKAELSGSMDSMRSNRFNLLFGFSRPCSTTTGKKRRVASIGRNRETTWDSPKLNRALLPAGKHQRWREIQKHTPHAYVSKES